MTKRWWQTTRNILIIAMVLLFTGGIGVLGYAEEEAKPRGAVLGALLALTGDYSSTGEASQAALEIALSEINEYFSDIGSETRVKLIIEDTKTDPMTALEKLKSLAKRGVKIVIGPQTSAEVKAVKNYADEKDNVFRFCPDDTLQAQAIANLIWEDGVRVIVPMWRGDAWGDELSEATRDSFEKLGGKVIDGIRYSPTTKDFSQELEFLNLKVRKGETTFRWERVGEFRHDQSFSDRLIYEKKPSLIPSLRVLVVHSYHVEWEWDQDIGKGIIEGLYRKGYIEGQDYELKTFCMDTKSTYTTPEQIKQRAKAAIDIIEEFSPDIVFVNDDNALTYVAVEYTKRYPDKNLPFVFSGINADPTSCDSIESLEVPGGPITGALERFPYYAAFSLGKRIFPKTSKILLLADKSPSSTFVVNAFRERYLDKVDDSPLQVSGPIQVATFKEWKEKVTEYQTKADFIGIITYHQLKDENGKVVLASEVVDWTVHNSKLPEIGFLSFHTEDGFLAAAGISGYKTGIYVGIIGGEILEGKNPATIPIIDPRAVEITFNLERAKMLGVKISAAELTEAVHIFHSIGTIGPAE